MISEQDHIEKEANICFDKTNNEYKLIVRSGAGSGA